MLFADDAEPRPDPDPDQHACGFYWTEGLRGLGWAVDAVPTLKGGSTIGIASPPAVRLASDGGWSPPGSRTPNGCRASPPGGRPRPSKTPGPGPGTGGSWSATPSACPSPSGLAAGPGATSSFEGEEYDLFQPGEAWPKAAWGRDHKAHRVGAGLWPTAVRLPTPTRVSRPLGSAASDRALSGFLAEPLVARFDSVWPSRRRSLPAQPADGVLMTDR